MFVCIILSIIIFAVYRPVRKHEFIGFDDQAYVSDNPNVLGGLNWQNIKWAFTTGHAANWHPLTWLSHQLDCTLFGQNPGAHHIVNVFFHIANSLLLFIVFNRMTRRIWSSAFVAALFALHPLHVESVAWIAERKDVLSAFFGLSAILAYSRYAERPSIVWYLATLVLFALGLMAKPMLVTLPFVLLLLDYWPLERFSNLGTSIRRLILEKLPFFFLAGISSIITYIVQQKGGAVPPIYVLTIKARLANGVVSYLAYIAKMFWPTSLALLYPHPVHIPLIKVVVSGIILISLTGIFIYAGRIYKYLAVGWLWYLGTLVPVIGIIQAGTQSMADRYTYIPLTGLFVIIAFGAADLFKKIPFKNIVLATAAVAVICACGIVTAKQLTYWQDSFSLFDHALAVTENNYMMHNNYGSVLSNLGRHEEAAEHFAETLKFIPNSHEAHNNYAYCLIELGRPDEAIEHLNTALKLKRNFPTAQYNIALALAAKGDYDGAIEQLKTYLGPNANVASAYNHLATILVKKDKLDDAIALLEEAIVLKGDSYELHTNLGILLEKKGLIKEAKECYKKAIQINPHDTKALDKLAGLDKDQAVR